MTKYKQFQKFLQDQGVWDEFKYKTLKNYRNCDMSMYKYYKLIVNCPEGWTSEEDLILSAFPYAQVRFGDNHPDTVWVELHLAWMAHIQHNEPKLQLLKD